MTPPTDKTDGRSPSRNLRSPDEVWNRALAATKARGTSVSAVCNAALIAYCDAYDLEQAVRHIAVLEARIRKLEHPPTPRKPRPTADKD